LQPIFISTCSNDRYLSQLISYSQFGLEEGFKSI